jgi:hypothetical protein
MGKTRNEFFINLPGWGTYVCQHLHGNQKGEEISRLNYIGVYPIKEFCCHGNNPGNAMIQARHASRVVRKT